MNIVIVTLTPTPRRLMRDAITEMAARGYYLRAIRYTGTQKRS